MRADVVVMMPPLFKDYLRFFERIKGFTVQQFIWQTSVKALVIAVLLWRAGLNIQRFNLEIMQPCFDGVCCKLGAVIAADMIRNSARNKQIRQNIHDLLCPQPVTRAQ